MTTTYSTVDELYTALLNQPTNGTIAQYMVKNQHTDETLSSDKGLNFIHTMLNVVNENGKKRKYPCYTTHSGNNLKFSLWEKFHIDNHTEYLDNTPQRYCERPLMEKCDTFIVLLNNNHSGDQYTVVDIDSKAELWKLYQSGFPMFDTPFTLSTTKKLPHFYIKCDHTHKQVLGDKFKRDFDLIVNYVFERKTNKVYGSPTIPLVKRDDIKRWLDIPDGILDQFADDFRYRVDMEMKRLNQVPASVVYDDYNFLKIDVGNKQVEPSGEVIPYLTLVRIINALPVDEYSTRSKWLCIVRATINMISTNSNVNDYLQLLNDFYAKSSNWNQSWLEEMSNVFVKFLNDGSYQGLGADWFYTQLKQHDPDLHTELAFHFHRDIDTRNFGKLDKATAVKVFNNRVAYLDGGVNQFVEFNASGNAFIFRKESELLSAYRNLYCVAKMTKYLPDGTPVDKVSKSKFLKLWLDDEDRKTYRGGVCFKAPPFKAPYNQFNLFTGFDIDRSGAEHWDDKISSMTKCQLETELAFILQHLRYLSGEDKTEEVFQFHLKYFAHLIKFPGILPRVSLIWTSVPGVGKNQWLNFIENILGSQYYYSSANCKEIVGDFNDVIRGKLLLNLNEFKTNKDFLEAIKELTTETTISTREKHKNAVRVENCARTIITTNNRPQILEFKARRYQVCRCSPYPASDEMRYDKQYGKELHDQISSLWIQKCFTYYCRNFVNVSKDYNFETNRIITDEYMLLRSRNIPMNLRFLRFWYISTQNDPEGQSYTSRELFALFKHFKQVENETSVWSSSEFVNEIESFTIRLDTSSYLQANEQAVIRMPKGKKQKYYILDRERCKAYLDSENIDTSVFLASSSEDDEEDE